jgi:hypothetical protein
LKAADIKPDMPAWIVSGGKRLRATVKHTSGTLGRYGQLWAVLDETGVWHRLPARRIHREQAEPESPFSSEPVQ